MRRREAISRLLKVKQNILDGNVVPNANFLYSDQEGNRYYSKEAVMATGTPCGCLVGLWYLVSGEDNYSVQGFRQYVGPVLSRKKSTYIEAATNVTAQGPSAMLKVINKALKRLEA